MGTTGGFSFYRNSCQTPFCNWLADWLINQNCISQIPSPARNPSTQPASGFGGLSFISKFFCHPQNRGCTAGTSPLRLTFYLLSFLSVPSAAELLPERLVRDGGWVGCLFWSPPPLPSCVSSFTPKPQLLVWPHQPVPSPSQQLFILSVTALAAFGFGQLLTDECGLDGTAVANSVTAPWRQEPGNSVWNSQNVLRQRCLRTAELPDFEEARAPLSSRLRGHFVLFISWGFGCAQIGTHFYFVLFCVFMRKCVSEVVIRETIFECHP